MLPHEFRLFTEGSVIPPEHRLMLVNFHRECIGDAKKAQWDRAMMYLTKLHLWLLCIEDLMNRHNLSLSSNAASEYGGWVMIAEVVKVSDKPLNLSKYVSVSAISTSKCLYLQDVYNISPYALTYHNVLMFSHYYPPVTNTFPHVHNVPHGRTSMRSCPRHDVTAKLWSVTYSPKHFKFFVCTSCLHILKHGIQKNKWTKRNKMNATYFSSVENSILSEVR